MSIPVHDVPASYTLRESVPLLAHAEVHRNMRFVEIWVNTCTITIGSHIEIVPDFCLAQIPLEQVPEDWDDQTVLDEFFDGPYGVA